jgi:hypothetical protein
MVRPLVRSLVSAVVAVCFAVMASTGGAMPACAGPGSVAAHAHHGSAGHPAGHHDGPAGSQGCIVHLCCAHLFAPSPAGLGGERLVALGAATGLAPSTELPVTRTPHTLPFAHGPPAPLV